MKYCSISKRFLVVNSSDSNVGHLKIGVIDQSEVSHLNWLKWLATEVFLLLRISNRWLWNLCLRERFVWPMYCKPQLSHSIKYIKLFELQLMLVCILKVFFLWPCSQFLSVVRNIHKWGKMAAHIVWRRHQCSNHNWMEYSKNCLFWCLLTFHFW